jgi:two-component system, chemotaxis family, response regulator Rcp1
VVIRIVIIEDNPADLRLFKEALRFFEIEAEVTHFPDGVTAVATIQSQQAPWNPPPDLVFLDLNMPRVSGFDVLTMLRSTPAYAETPVAIFTSSQAPADIDRAEELRASRFLQKPTSLRDFFNVVSSTVREFAPLN